MVEILVASAVSTVVGGIIFVVASQGVNSFARNASINRAYTDARQAINQINAAVQSAGQAPTLIDANGLTSDSPAEGVRFYRYGALPSYQIPSGKTTDKTLTINFSRAQANGSRFSPVNVGDLATIPLIGFQATVYAVTNLTFNSDGSGKVTLGFNNVALADNCVPKLNSTANFAFVAANSSTTPPTPATYYACLVYQQVAFIAVPNATGGGAQLRYYPQAMSTGSGGACGGLSAFNSATAFNNSKNYTVIANITGTVTDSTLTPLTPFYNPDSDSVLKTVLCAEAPDYNNRSLNAVNTYSIMQSSMASRCPILLR